MAEEEFSRVPVWRIPRRNAGYIYIIEAGGRLKIGKSKHRESRIRDARTWLPDMAVVGVKPFWNVNYLEKELHEGLAQWWYEGETFLAFVLYGHEFVLNSGGPSVKGYEEWLEYHGGISPLVERLGMHLDGTSSPPKVFLVGDALLRAGIDFDRAQGISGLK